MIDASVEVWHEAVASSRGPDTANAPKPVPGEASVQGATSGSLLRFEMDRAAASQIIAAATAADAQLAAYGLALRVPTRVVVHASRSDFERATGHTEPGLRAWTQYDVVHLMPLVHWADTTLTAQIARLTHELCHAALHQAFRSHEDAARARIPRFFEEGVCSVVARQTAARMPLPVALAGIEVMHAPTLFSRDAFEQDPARAYALAHHAAAWIEARFGAATFAAVIRDAARDGSPGCVERALHSATGVTVLALWRNLVQSAKDKGETKNQDKIENEGEYDDTGADVELDNDAVPPHAAPS